MPVLHVDERKKNPLNYPETNPVDRGRSSLMAKGARKNTKKLKFFFSYKKKTSNVLKQKNMQKYFEVYAWASVKNFFLIFS